MKRWYYLLECRLCKNRRYSPVEKHIKFEDEYLYKLNEIINKTNRDSILFHHYCNKEPFHGLNYDTVLGICDLIAIVELGEKNEI